MRFAIGLVHALAVLGAFGAAVGIGLGLLQSLHPAMDSFSHFRLHFVAVLAVCAALLSVMSGGKRRWLAMLVLVLSVGALTLEARKGPPREGGSGDLRIVQFNLNYRNPVVDQVADMLVALDGDIVTLQEVTDAHRAILSQLTAFPHQVYCPFGRKVGGLAILSRHAFAADPVCTEGLGVMSVPVALPGGSVTVVSLHTHWPWPFDQHRQVDRMMPLLQAIKGPVIVAGDFNAAPWSDTVDKIARASRTEAVPGVRITIGVRPIDALPPVPIPIDHVLLSTEFCGLSAAVGPQTGSDHYPVIVEIGRTSAASPARCAP